MKAALVMTQWTTVRWRESTVRKWTKGPGLVRRALNLSVASSDGCYFSLIQIGGVLASMVDMM
jgi:hypothetical protein